MLRIWKIRNWSALVALGAMLCPIGMSAQDEAKQTPLGDVARSLRKKATNRAVIDDDNLPEVMQQAQERRGWGSSLRSMMSGETSIVRLSAPDVTCNLSFSSNMKSLLSKQYAEMGLPGSDLARLEGRASIDGDDLNISVHNGTDWHVSELAVAFTVSKRSTAEQAPSAGPMDYMPSANELQGEKKPDTTVIYRMRAVGVPWAVTTFSTRLQSDLESGSDWRWAIVEAKGYPPETYRRSVSAQVSSEANEESATNLPDSTASAPEQKPEITPVSNPQQRPVELMPSSAPQ